MSIAERGLSAPTESPEPKLFQPSEDDSWMFSYRIGEEEGTIRKTVDWLPYLPGFNGLALTKKTHKVFLFHWNRLDVIVRKMPPNVDDHNGAYLIANWKEIVDLLGVIRDAKSAEETD